MFRVMEFSFIEIGETNLVICTSSGKKPGIRHYFTKTMSTKTLRRHFERIFLSCGKKTSNKLERNVSFT